MPDFISSLLAWLGASKYIVLFAGAIFEGPLLMITSGFLWHLGELKFGPMYLSLLGGDLAGDIGWYLVGRHGAGTIVRRYGRWLGITPEIIAKLEHRFHRHHHKILFFSKLTMGFGLALPMLIVSGMLRVPLKNFIALNLAGGIIWTVFLLVIGYFFGNIYTVIPSELKVVFVLVGLLFLIWTIRSVKSHLLTVES